MLVEMRATLKIVLVMLAASFASVGSTELGGGEEKSPMPLPVCCDEEVEIRKVVYVVTGAPMSDRNEPR